MVCGAWFLFGSFAGRIGVRPSRLEKRRALVAIPGAVFFFLLSLWQYRVLIRWDVKALFGLQGKRVPLPDEM